MSLWVSFSIHIKNCNLSDLYCHTTRLDLAVIWFLSYFHILSKEFQRTWNLILPSFHILSAWWDHTIFTDIKMILVVHSWFCLTTQLEIMHYYFFIPMFNWGQRLCGKGRKSGQGATGPTLPLAVPRCVCKGHVRCLYSPPPDLSDILRVSIHPSTSIKCSVLTLF